MATIDDVAKQGRVFVHKACGGETVITEQDFVEICNPMYYPRMQGVRCAKCERPAPLSQVAWADTGETIAAFRKRMSGLVPGFWRYLVCWGWIVAGAAVGGAIGAFFGAAKGHAVAGALAGILAGVFALAQLLEPDRVAGWLKLKFHHQK